MGGRAREASLAFVIVIVMMATAVSAHHGSPFTAYGTATLDTGNVFDATLQWGGTATNVARVTLREPGTGVALAPISVVVDYDFGKVRWETRDGCDVVEAIEETYTSKVPGLLALEGTRYTNWCADPLDMYGPLAGRFLSAFDVELCMSGRCA